MSRETREKKEKKSSEARDKQRRKVIRYLSQLDLFKAVKSTSLFETIASVNAPKLRVLGSSNSSLTDDETQLFERIEKKARELTFVSPELGEITILDYFCIVKPICDFLHDATSSQPEVSRAIAAARPRLSSLRNVEVASKALVDVLKFVEEELLKVGRINTSLYPIHIDHGRDDRDRWFANVIVEPYRSHPTQISTADGPRVGYRCGQPFGKRGIEWSELPSSAFGQSDGRTYPVFVQVHALENLYGREARALFIQNGEWLVHDYLWQSLRKPKVHKMPSHSNKFLIEYWLNVHKIGYLVVHRLKDLVLIDTFLFLTMSGTPEGDKLWSRLGFGRSQREYLQLDKIGTFLMTDVKFDPELVAILSECGCGHLFNILKEPLKDLCRTGYSAEIRKHIGLSES